MPAITAMLKPEIKWVGGCPLHPYRRKDYFRLVVTVTVMMIVVICIVIADANE